MVRSTRRPLAALATLGCVVLGGCYTYQVAPAPAVGSPVRVTVPVTSAVNRSNAAPETVAIEGILLDAGDTLVVATRTRREFGAYRELIQYDTLRLGRDQTTALEVREFSSTRSIVLGSVIALGAAGAAVLAFDAGGGSGGQDGNGGEPPALSVNGTLLSQLWGLLTR